MKNNRRNKLIIISALVVVIIGILLVAMYFNNNKNRVYKNNNYIVKYDSSWELKNHKDNSLSLVHGTNSKININIYNLDDEKKYSDIDSLIDNILYNVGKNNSTYKLISSKKDKITKYDYDGYKILYEEENNETMLVVYKVSDKLVSIEYSANIDCFDIVLDSVNSIIYNFELIEKKFNLKNKIELDTESISFDSNPGIEKQLKKTNKYELAAANYYVEYEIPSNFKLTDYNSTIGLFNYDVEDISLSITVLNRNIYEYLEKDNSLSIYKDYSVYKKEKNYSEYTELVNRVDDNNYIYKNSYKYNNKTITNIVLIKNIDRNHILVTKIISNNVLVPKKLIDMINIKNINKYSSYIKRKVKNGYVQGELKHFSTFVDNTVLSVNLNVDESFKELDQENNMYKERVYATNYNDMYDTYDYIVNYKLLNVGVNIESHVKTIESTFISDYGTVNYLTSSGDFTLNDTLFTIYSGGYTNLSGIIFTNNDRNKYYVSKKVLFTKLKDDSYLVIEITGNGKEITDDIVNKLVNFSTK